MMMTMMMTRHLYSLSVSVYISSIALTNRSRVSTNDNDIQHVMESQKEEASSADYDQVEHGWARCQRACSISVALKY